MATSGALYKYRRQPHRRRTVETALEAAVTVLAAFLLFIAALEFLHALSPLSGIGAQFVEASQAIVGGIIDTAIAPLFPMLDRAAANYALMMTGLIATISATARDARVHLVSLALGVSTLFAMYLYSMDAADFALSGEGGGRVGALPYAILTLLCGAAMLAIFISFRLHHVPRRKSEQVEKRKEKFLMLYWGLVAVFCIFQFFFLMTGPQASQETASSAIMIIAGTAALFLLGLYMIASVLLLAQIVLWKGVFALNDEMPLSVMEIAQHPFPTAVDPAISPAASFTLMALIAFAWLGYSLCAVSGAVNTMKLVMISLIAVLGALATALISLIL